MKRKQDMISVTSPIQVTPNNDRKLHVFPLSLDFDNVTLDVLEHTIYVMEQAVKNEAKHKVVEESVILDEYLKREEEYNAMLRQKVHDDYLLLAPDLYLEKFGYRPILPDQVSCRTLRSKNKAFNRKLQERIFLHNGQLPQDYSRLVTLKKKANASGRIERLAWNTLNGFWSYTETNQNNPLESNFAIRECHQRESGFTVGDILADDAFVEFHDGENDDSPCPASNVYRACGDHENSEQRTYLYIQQIGESTQIMLVTSHSVMNTEFRSQSNASLKLDIVIDFKVPRYQWTQKHEEWKKKVLESQRSTESTLVTDRNSIRFILENFGDNMVENVGNRLSYVYSLPTPCSSSL